MKEHPEGRKKLSEVEEKQNRWIGRRIESQDVRETPKPETEQASVASAPAAAMPLECALEQLAVGPTMGPSGQGGDELFDAGKSVQQFQQKINMLEKSIEDLKKQVIEAKESEEGLKPLKVMAEEKPASKYDLAELFSPPRMTEMTQAFGLKGGWSIDDRFKDPITGRTYDLRNRKDQNEVRKMVRRDKPLVLTVYPPCTLFSIANQGPIDSKELAGQLR